MGGTAGLGAAGQSGAAAAKGGAPMGGGMGGGNIISEGAKGLVGLFGGLMDDARKRRLAEAQGMAQAAGTEAEGVAGAAGSQADRQARAFDSMMTSFGSALR